MPLPRRLHFKDEFHETKSRAIFTIIVSSFVVQPVLVSEHNFNANSDKIERVSQGLPGHIGVAAQEIASRLMTMNRL